MASRDRVVADFLLKLCQDFGYICIRVCVDNLLPTPQSQQRPGLACRHVVTSQLGGQGMQPLAPCRLDVEFFVRGALRRHPNFAEI